ncbi:hypothetical protein D3P07_19880 [Paenibacillus sp. 1011MAR3C5]|nr:hypothetical protein D3P07_19880 [Paenibacillus sp. 1011MAR3C5]
MNIVIIGIAYHNVVYYSSYVQNYYKMHFRSYVYEWSMEKEIREVGADSITNGAQLVLHC